MRVIVFFCGKRRAKLFESHCNIKFILQNTRLLYETQNREK